MPITLDDETATMMNSCLEIADKHLEMTVEGLRKGKKKKGYETEAVELFEKRICAISSILFGALTMPYDKEYGQKIISGGFSVMSRCFSVEDTMKNMGYESEDIRKVYNAIDEDVRNGKVSKDVGEELKKKLKKLV